MNRALLKILIKHAFEHLDSPCGRLSYHHEYREEIVKRIHQKMITVWLIVLISKHLNSFSKRVSQWRVRMKLNVRNIGFPVSSVSKDVVTLLKIIFTDRKTCIKSNSVWWNVENNTLLSFLDYLIYKHTFMVPKKSLK